MSDTETIQIKRTDRGFRLSCAVTIDRPIDDVFDFFADAGNLDRLTPPSLKFEILTPQPIDMHVGRLIDYRLRMHGVPIRWWSEISAWDPPHRFVDEQRRGPYRFWIHEHRFTRQGEATHVIDEVHYGMPLGWIAHTLFVRRDLQHIFAFRSRTLRELFKNDASRRAPDFAAAMP